MILSRGMPAAVPTQRNSHFEVNSLSVTLPPDLEKADLENEDLKNEDAEKNVIRLEGELGIANSAELKETLLTTIASPKNLELDLSAVTDIDVTTIQLLYAAARETRKSNSPLGIRGKVPEHIQQSVQQAGFTSFPLPILSSPNQSSPQWRAQLQPELNAAQTGSHHG
jgi:anti-anti-sigma regulatory factor